MLPGYIFRLKNGRETYFISRNPDPVRAYGVAFDTYEWVLLGPVDDLNNAELGKYAPRVADALSDIKERGWFITSQTDEDLTRLKKIAG